MARYHMKPNGQPGKCSASVKACPLGADAIHGGTVEEVYEAFEKAMKASMVPAGVSKNSRPATPAKAVVTDLTTDPYKGRTVSARTFYVQWDSMEEGCAEELKGRECSTKNDYAGCRHGTHRGIYLTDKDIQTTIAESLDLEKLPQELKDSIDWSNPKDLFVVEREPDYYSESVTVRPKKSVQKILDDYHYSRPNVASPNGGLEFARVNGLDTSGKDEVQAIQALVGGKLSADVKKRVEAADTTYKQTIPLAKLKVTKTKYDKAASANIPLNNQKANNAAGVVVANGDGTYTLVSDDYSRFKTVASAGRKGWSFYVLSTAPKYERGFRSYVEKEPLVEGRVDTSDW